MLGILAVSDIIPPNFFVTTNNNIIIQGAFQWMLFRHALFQPVYHNVLIAAVDTRLTFGFWKDCHIGIPVEFSV